MRPHRLPSRPVTAALVGLVLAIGVSGCGADAPADAATVAEVVDGSTVEVTQGDEVVTVRLVGVESPAADECLGAESASALGDLLPVGTEVRMEQAEAVSDGTVVAGLYAEDVLVGAELVRWGLAFAADDATPAIADAEQEAIDAAVGLFGTDVECTVPAQVADLEAAAAEATSALAAGIGLDAVDRRAALVATAVTTGAALAALLDGDESRRYPDGMVTSLRGRTLTVNESLGGATAAVQQVRAAEEQRIEGERVAAEAAAQAAADEAARQAQAAADAEAARVAAEAAAAKAEAPAAAVYYQNCDAVRAAGADPIYAGQPGYSGKLDRDGDGVACEK